MQITLHSRQQSLVVQDYKYMTATQADCAEGVLKQLLKIFLVSGSLTAHTNYPVHGSLIAPNAQQSQRLMLQGVTLNEQKGTLCCVVRTLLSCTHLTVWKALPHSLKCQYKHAGHFQRMPLRYLY